MFDFSKAIDSLFSIKKSLCTFFCFIIMKFILESYTDVLAASPPETSRRKLMGGVISEPSNLNLKF